MPRLRDALKRITRGIRWRGRMPSGNAPRMVSAVVRLR